MNGLTDLKALKSTALKDISPMVYANTLRESLDKFRDNWNDLDYIVIENQPVLKNPTMKNI